MGWFRGVEWGGGVGWLRGWWSGVVEMDGGWWSGVVDRMVDGVEWGG